MSGKQPTTFDMHIDRLADQVQEALVGGVSLTEADLVEEMERLAQAGFGKHHQGRPLDQLVENRVVEKYPEPAIHRRAELQAMLRPVIDAWNRVADFTEKQETVNQNQSAP